MLGYVTAEKAELKMREYEVYSAYYCGLCKSIGERHGQVARMTLSYDFAFLALLLASLTEDTECIRQEHCLVHHIKKKNIAHKNPCIDYAADLMVLLVHYNLQDDIKDENSMKARAASLFFHHSYKKLSKTYDNICMTIEKELAELSRLESEKCGNLDMVCDSFANIMEVIFSGYGQSRDSGPEAEKSRVLGHLGRFLGKWIYLADAWDDLEEDIEKGTYNPFLYRFKYENEKSVDFRERIRENVEFSMMSSLAEVAKAYELLDIKKNKGITDNVIYFGLLRKTEQLLKKGNTDNERSI